MATNPDFEQWKSYFITNFVDAVCKTESVANMSQIFQDIIEKGKINDSFFETTDYFLDNFCVKLLEVAINTNANSFSDKEKIKHFFELFSYLFEKLILTDHINFLINTVDLLFNANAPIFQSSDEILESAQKAFTGPIFIAELQQYMNQSMQKYEFDRIYIFVKVANSLNLSKTAKFAVDEFMNSLVPFLGDMLKTVQISVINDRYTVVFFEELFRMMRSMCKSEEQRHQVFFVRMTLDFALSKCSKPQKQARGLKGLVSFFGKATEDEKSGAITLMKNCNLLKVLCNGLIQKEGVVDMCRLLMIYKKTEEVDDSYYSGLWNLTKNQSDEDIKEFIKAWMVLLKEQEEKMSDLITQCVKSLGSVNQALLLFINKFSPFIKDKVAVFQLISSDYLSNQGKDTELTVATLEKLVPDDEKFVFSIREKCMSFIKNNEKLEFSIGMIILTIKKLNEGEAHSLFDEIVNLEAVSTTVKSLSLFTKIMSFYSNGITEQEYDLLNKVLEKIANIDLEKTCNFILANLQTKRFPQKNVFDLIKIICDSKSGHEIPINTLSFTYRCLRESDRAAAINEMWKRYFEKPEENLCQYLVEMYGFTPIFSSISTMIDKCFTNLDKKGAFIALINLIKYVEGGVDRVANKFIPLNGFSSKEDLCEVTINCNPKTIQLTVPKDLNYQAFKARVSSALQINMQSFYITNGKMYCTNENFDLETEKTFYVNISCMIPFRPPLPNVFPSQIIQQGQYSQKIFDIMKSDDKNLGSLALELLNLIPTLESQNEILRNFNTDDPKIWATFFDYRTKYLLLYRMHMVGSIISTGAKEWTDFFYRTGGLKVLLGLVVFALRKTFENEDKQILFVLRLVKFVMQQEAWNKYKSDVIAAFDENALKTLVQFAIDFSEKKDIVYELISIIAFFSIDSLKNVDNFADLFNKTIFHESFDVRKAISELVSPLPASSQARLLMPLLRYSVKYPSESFFNLLTPISQVVDNPQPLWEPVLYMLFEVFTPPVASSELDKLIKEQQTDCLIANRLITILFNLSSKYKEIPNADKLIPFIVNSILFNGSKYYEPSSDEFELLKRLLKENKAYVPMVKQQMFKAQEIVNEMPEDSELILAGKKIEKRGILGIPGTQFASSVLLELFNEKDNFICNFLTKEFPSTSEYNDIFQMQLLFSELLYFPAVFLSPKRLMKTLTCSPDPFDFYRRFVRKLSEVDGFSTMFRGRMTRYLRSVDNSLKYHEAPRFFSLFPLDIVHKNVEAGISAYLGEKIVKGADRTEFYSKDYLSELPQILVLQAVRIFQDQRTGKKCRNGKAFDYPFELNVSKFVSETNVDNTEYELDGVVSLHGTPDQGHYITYVKSGDKKWTSYDGSEIKEITQKKMYNLTVGGFDLIESYNDKANIPQMMPVERPESAVLFFYRQKSAKQEDEEMIQVSQPVITALITEMKQYVLRSVITCPMYSDLMLKVGDGDADFKFLYKNILSYASVSGLTEVEDSQQELIDRFNLLMQTDASTADFVISQESDFNDYILKQENVVARRMYLELLKNAYDACTAQKKAAFEENVKTMLKSTSGVLVNSWKHLDQFFEVVQFCVKADLGSGLSYLDPILHFISITIPFMTKTYGEENIITFVNVGILFDALQDIPLTNEIRSIYLTQIITRSFIERWIKPRKCSTKFCDFIVTFVGQAKICIDALNKVVNEAVANKSTPLTIASYFQLCYSFPANISSSMYKVLTHAAIKSGTNFRKEFLHELSFRLSDVSVANFATNSKDLLKAFILSKNEETRRAMVLFIDTIIPCINEPPTVQLSADQSNDILQMFITLFGLLPDVVSEFREMRDQYLERFVPKEIFLKSIPAFAYFGVLKKLAIRTDLSHDIIECGATIIDTMGYFAEVRITPNFPLIASFDFLVSVLPDSKEFFEKNSFTKFIKTLSTFKSNFPNQQDLVRLLTFIPKHKFEAFVKSECFESLTRVLSPELRMYVEDNLTPETAKIVAKALWSESTFNAQIRAKKIDFFILSWRLLGAYPSTNSIFHSNHLYIKILKATNKLKSDLTPPALELLSVFNMAYIEENKNAKTVFGKNKLTVLTDSYIKEKLDVKALVGALSRQYNESFAKAGISDFLCSLISLSGDLRNTIFATCISYEKPFLKDVEDMELQLSIAKFICELCNSKFAGVDASQVLLIQEVVYARGKAIDMLCSQYTKNEQATGISCEFNMLLRSIDYIMKCAIDVTTFNGSTLQIALELAPRAEKEMVEEWCKRCMTIATVAAKRILSSVQTKDKSSFKNDADTFNASANCCEALQSKIGLQEYKIDIKKSEVNEVINQNKGIDTLTKDVLDCIILHCAN